MKTNKELLAVSTLTLAVQGALLAMFAMPPLAFAADDEVTALTQPTNSIEVGVGNVSQKSAKFGEYNGLNDSGTNGIVNFDIRGGNAHDGSNGATRWQIKGTDLGTTSRSLDGSVSNQGQWNLNIGHDELRHNITDTYRTPQQGSMGGNSFTVPANFGTVRGDITPLAQPQPKYQNQLDAFHTEEVGTTRKNTSFGTGYTFNRQLGLQFDYNHLDQSGAKLIGTGALGGMLIPGSTGTWRAEGNNIVMNPTNYQTDTFNLALNWVGDKGHLTGGYYASIFKDGYDRLSFDNVITNNATGACASGGACVYQRTVMSTAPDNSLHQLNLSGGYAFSPATKLAGGLSYGRNTQNNSYLSGQPEIVSALRPSLDGLVVTTHADLKLTNQTTKELMLSAGFKYNERDNRSPSNIYQFYAINSGSTASTNKIDAAANAPYSNRRTQLELAADYRLAKGQNVRLAYEHEDIKRWCNNYGITASNCLVNPSNNEDKLSVGYRLKARGNVSFNAGYSYANRKADFDGSAVTPLGGLDVPTGGMDVNAQNYPGYIAYPYAARQQQLLKAGVNWQANEKLDFGLSGRYVDDKYDAVLGVQDGSTAGINLDATYSYTENSSVSAYVSRQNSDRSLRAGAASIPATGTGAALNTATSYAALVASTNIWTNQLKGDSNAIGISTRHRGLMGGKLEIIGDLSYSLDNSRYSTQVPYLATCGAANTLTCGDTPDIKSELFTLKLTGNYQVNKRAKVAVGYIYQKLNSSDYYYNGLQNGYTPNRLLPTNEQAPNYSVNVVTVSYLYNF